MSADNNGGPAFPIQNFLHHGMTLRDYFAAKAMQGIISAPSADGDGWYEEEDVAENAYLMADAMLKARQS